jgi:ATP synthase protein I
MVQKDAGERLVMLQKRLDDIALEQTPKAQKQDSLGTGMNVAIGFCAGVVVGLGVGYGLDRYFGTRPWFVLAGLMLGMAAGWVNVLRSLKKKP